MSDACGLLHNMSAPPKSVVKYSGLADLAPHPRGASGIGAIPPPGNGTYGLPVRFELIGDFTDSDPEAILHELGLDPTTDPAVQLDRLIDARANELPLPDGCVVIPTSPADRQIWNDPLTALAVLAKCSDAIWLRAKLPALNAALARRSATLLVPPAFTSQLPEIDQ